jgi:transcriptional regulator with XRE-family HTH domain
MSDLHRRLAVRVRDLAEIHGLSQNRLADFAGMGRASLSRLLTGRYSPTLRTLERIADALGVRVIDLLDD